MIARVATTLGLLLALPLPLPLAQADFSARVVGITDDDTIKVLDGTNIQHKIRLAGIDAPERRQPCGSRSTQGLADLLAGKDVTIEDRETDRWGRIIAVVWVNPAGLPNVSQDARCGHGAAHPWSGLALQAIRPRAAG